MTATRWTLILLLTTGAAAGSWVFMSREPVALPAATAAARGASPLGLPLSPAAASEPAASAAMRAPAPVVASSASAPRIGSEGYGPHIERAQAGSDAAAAWEAIQWLRNCTTTEARRYSFEQVRAQGIEPEMMTQLMVEVDAEARRCQTVTARHQALLPELAARAMRAGVPEAAAAYANTVFPGGLTPSQRQEVADALRRDARAGDVRSLLGAAQANEAWGLSDAERLAFLAAYGQTPGHGSTGLNVKLYAEQGAIRLQAPPTPEQLVAAKLAGQQIVEPARANAQP
ncbi:hypothetical protein [Pelomonas sp. Root1444]|uniref:hypothetical protein n=1 Tax=Pelomonas sp. Root1444 TaxID=1736464 RepID=UPI0007031F8F|nr:hypothetical protein [Pelomonas sp. Root1444]KQY90665.1 hypothetical protein ASD35_02330 [Pelomonas sp. Root1444]